ncbi:Xaa-Pro dipeptidase [Natronospira bacteriovora]|uniref:Xaa-Pro dipeptidase n=1 Tax=Natronospira bacteriovora TaxID=3069753 RepID=A0ABU0W4P3_9GAMM|nr:Xaa-Pro dipeptidase [Natronospira sp. AB-CW4]MDQ2068728.1 Xaa-Pro dipeptidase [Natronospira sp. AB-CW4]
MHASPQIAGSDHHTAHVETVCERFDAALRHTGLSTAIVGSGRVGKRFLDDIAYPFKVNPLFNYWVPLTAHPDSYVVYQSGQRPRLLLHAPSDFWHKTPESPSGTWTEAFDIELFDDAGKLEAALPDGEATALLAEDRPDGLTKARQNPEALINFLHFDRAWKTDYEKDCMREANRLGALAHRAAEKAFREGASEYEIHQAFCTACGHTQNELPYPAIIALNANGSTLHYDRLERQSPTPLLSFLIDAGAAHAGYASDITRSYSAADREFAELIEALDELQRTLCDGVRPGVSFGDLHDQTHRLLATVLADWSLITVSAEEAFDSGLTRTFFPHGLGHFIGLQVHDVGGHMADHEGNRAPPPPAHPYLRTTRVLDEGHSLTVEPGLYFIDNLLDPLREKKEGAAINWSRVDHFRPYGGIRIEDDILVTASGHENMTRDAFASLD